MTLVSGVHTRVKRYTTMSFAQNVMSAWFYGSPLYLLAFVGIILLDAIGAFL